MAPETKKPDEPVKEVKEAGKKKYKLQKSALKHNGVMYPEGSVIELTDSEAKGLKHLLTLMAEK